MLSELFFVSFFIVDPLETGFLMLSTIGFESKLFETSFATKLRFYTRTLEFNMTSELLDLFLLILILLDLLPTFGTAVPTT